MTEPSLTLARRLYARTHGLPVERVGAHAGVWGDAGWAARVCSRSTDSLPLYEIEAATERAAVRRLCRALGWRPGKVRP